MGDSVVVVEQCGDLNRVVNGAIVETMLSQLVQVVGADRGMALGQCDREGAKRAVG